MVRKGEIGVEPGGSSTLHRSAESIPALARRHLPAVAGYALPFLLVAYLGLAGGGYDPIVRGEVGIAVWWIVLLGALAGALPAARISRGGWVMLGLLAAFTAWTALGIGWSESSERSVEEVGRLASYLGVFALVLVAQGRDGLRRTVHATGAAIALIGAVALLSRLHPEWFAATDPESFIDTAGRRLNYPLDYWNGLAGLVAIGIPLLLWIATGARHVVTRALAAAALPAMSLALLYTLSRGGALAALIAVAVLLALHPARLSMLPTLLVGGIGSGLAVAAALQRDALVDGLSTPAAASQADEMFAIALIACAGVGLLTAAIALADRVRRRAEAEGLEVGGTGRDRDHRGPGDRRRPGRGSARPGLRRLGRLQAAAGDRDHDQRRAVLERQRQRPLPDLVLRRRRRQERAPDRNRSGHVRVLVGSGGDAPPASCAARTRSSSRPSPSWARSASA